MHACIAFRWAAIHNICYIAWYCVPSYLYNMLSHLCRLTYARTLIRNAHTPKTIATHTYTYLPFRTFIPTCTHALPTCLPAPLVHTCIDGCMQTHLYLHQNMHTCMLCIHAYTKDCRGICMHTFVHTLHTIRMCIHTHTHIIYIYIPADLHPNMQGQVWSLDYIFAHPHASRNILAYCVPEPRFVASFCIQFYTAKPTFITQKDLCQSK